MCNEEGHGKRRGVGYSLLFIAGGSNSMLLQQKANTKCKRIIRKWRYVTELFDKAGLCKVLNIMG